MENENDERVETEKKRIFVMYDPKYAVYHEGQRVGIDEDLKERLHELGLIYLRDVKYSTKPCSVFEYNNCLEKLEDMILKTEGVLDIIYDSPAFALIDS